MHLCSAARRRLLVTAVVLSLSACQEASEPPKQEQAQESAPAGPEAKPGIAVSGARLVLPVVKGNPGAVYFELANSGDKSAELAAVYVTGSGGAEVHETQGGEMKRLPTVPIKPGQTVSFAPGGKHVMAFDLLDTLKAGSTTEMTLSFSDGDKLSTPLRIEAMGGMDHGSGH